MPGPDVDVIARAPAHPAPITMPIDAISSSACTIANVAYPLTKTTRYFFMNEISLIAEAVGAPPPEQGFEPNHFAGLHRDLRLGQ